MTERYAWPRTAHATGTKTSRWYIPDAATIFRHFLCGWEMAGPVDEAIVDMPISQPVLMRMLPNITGTSNPYLYNASTSLGTNLMRYLLCICLRNGHES